MTQLAELLACARAACREAQVEADCTLRIELALEELFTNTVCHGYGGDCESPVWLQAIPVPVGVHIRYEDAAPAYNPLEHEARPGQACAPGGLGVQLVRCLANEVAYQRIEGRNVLMLTFVARRGGGASTPS